MYFTFLSLFYLLATEGYAQDDNTGDGGNNGSIDDELPTLTTSEGGDGGDTTCYTRYTIVSLRVTNLFLNKLTQRYEVPAGAPDIYVRAMIGQTASNAKHPGTLWSYLGDYGPNSEPVYQANIGFDLDYSDYCSEKQPSVTDTLRYEILTKDTSGNFIPYPICDQNEVGDVFSCKVFSDIPCDIELDGFCISTNYNFGLEEVELDCECKSSSPQFMGTNPMGSSNAASGASLQARLDIVPQQNPFGTSLELNWSDHASDEELMLSIYNTAGQLVQHFSSYGEFGAATFDTSDLPPGLYVLVAQNSTSREVVKLVKR